MTPESIHASPFYCAALRLEKQWQLITRAKEARSTGNAAFLGGFRSYVTAFVPIPLLRVGPLGLEVIIMPVRYFARLLSTWTLRLISFRIEAFGFISIKLEGRIINDCLMHILRANGAGSPQEPLERDFPIVAQFSVWRWSCTKL